MALNATLPSPEVFKRCLLCRPTEWCKIFPNKCHCFKMIAKTDMILILDEDECLLGKDECHIHADCFNTPPGSYTCVCKTGYRGDGKLECELIRKYKISQGVSMNMQK